MNDYINNVERFGSLLHIYKSCKDPLSLMFLVDSERAMRVAAAWPYIPNIIDWDKVEKLKKQEQSDSDKVWRLLWDYTKPDIGRLSQMSEVSYEKTLAVFLTLKTARLIFPDNTIHEQARKIVGNYIAGQIRRQ